MGEERQKVELATETSVTWGRCFALGAVRLRALEHLLLSLPVPSSWSQWRLWLWVTLWKDVPISLEVYERPFHVFSTHLKHRNSKLSSHPHSPEVIVDHPLERHQNEIWNFADIFLKIPFAHLCRKVTKPLFWTPLPVLRATSLTLLLEKLPGCRLIGSRCRALSAPVPSWSSSHLVKWELPEMWFPEATF